MDLLACRKIIDELDETIIKSLAQRSEYPLGSGFKAGVEDNDFYNSLLACVCYQGEIPEEDLGKVLEIEGSLETSLNQRFELAEQIIDYKTQHNMVLVDSKREAEIINNAGAYAAEMEKDPEAYKGAFRLIINRMKVLEKQHKSEN